MDLERQAGRKAIDVNFIRLYPFRFEENLVPVLIRKFHDLVFNGWAVSRSDALNLSRIKWRLMEVLSDDLGCLIVREGHVTGQLAIQFGQNRAWGILCIAGSPMKTVLRMFHVEQIILPIGKVGYRFVAWLNIGLGEINRAA